MHHSPFSRRDFIKALGIACGGLLSTKTLATGESNYLRKQSRYYNHGQFFSPQEMELLASLVETIIPKTESLGAAAVDTHGYIDSQLTSCVSQKEARAFHKNLLMFERVVVDEKHMRYAELEADEKNNMLRLLSRGVRPFGKKQIHFFRQLKNMTLMGYYTSEEGASIELAYLPIPGAYDAQFKVNQINKSWAY